MTRRWIAAVALSAALALAGCGASGGSDDEAGAGSETATTEASATSEATPTTEATTTSEATTTEVETTTTVVGGELPPCQELLEQYAAAFDPDDLSEVIALFRSWAPSMPADVGAATTRLADAYEAADGDLGGIDMTDVDLTADAEIFSDWTNEGCPPG